MARQSQDPGIYRLRAGGLITNYACTSRCRHCLYACSPARSKAYLTAELAEAVLRKVAALGCASLHIGGGEPLLAPDKLLPCLKKFGQLGMGVEYVETNSSWYKGLDTAVPLLGDLKRYGLHTLLVSISPFHNEFIPLARVKGVMAACNAAGVAIFPWIESFYRDLAAFPEDRPHPLTAYTEKYGPDYLKKIPERYWVALRGRALTTYTPWLPLLPWEALTEQAGDGGCRELFDTSHFHIDLDGNYVPGLCAGLAIRFTDLGKPLPAETYPLLTTLMRGGIKAFTWLAIKEYGFEPEPAYASKCALCQDIRTHLVQSKQLVTQELQPAEFYTELD